MDWNTKENKRLVEAILALKNSDEAERFLRDIMTKKEIEELANRLKAAEMLARKVPYSIIGEETGLSSTTIARVSRWLKGPGGGYKLVFKKL